MVCTRRGESILHQGDYPKPQGLNNSKQESWFEYTSSIPRPYYIQARPWPFALQCNLDSSFCFSGEIQDRKKREHDSTEDILPSSTSLSLLSLPLIMTPLPHGSLLNKSVKYEYEITFLWILDTFSTLLVPIQNDVDWRA